MKYRLNVKLNDIFNAFIYNNKIYYTSKKENFKLIEKDLTTFEITWKSDEEHMSDWAVNNNWLIYNFEKEEVTKILEKGNKKEYFKVDKTFVFENALLNEKKIVGTTTAEGIIIVDILTRKYEIYRDLDLISKILLEKKVICVDEKKKKYIKAISVDNLQEQWHFDIGQFGPYREWDFIKKEWEERRREIYRVYYHQGKIIATLSRAIIALDPEDGHLIWKIDFEDISPVELVFDGNIAYLGELLHFLIIDIEEGKVLFHRYDPAYKIEIEGYKLSQITYHGLSLYKNYLWLARNISGREFLLKINPKNGEIVDGMLLDTNYTCHPPIFQGERMYILDQVGDLYVYEEVEEGGVAAAEQEEEEVYTQVLDIKGKKHIFIYTEKWCRALEDKLEACMIHYWVKGSIKQSDDVRFVFQRTEGINEETLYGEMIKFLDSDRIRAVLASLPAASVKALVGEEVHPEYQPYYLVNFFRNKDNFSKMFRMKD